MKIERMKIMEKKNFIVTIEETISQNFDIEAESLEEALEIARKKYCDDEFVVESGSVTFVQAQAMTEDATEMTPWEEI